MKFWKETLKSAKYVMAPMVDQSELAWRILCRRYGVELCYTPMLHARLFGNEQNQKYRDENFTTIPEDRPLIAQFCANDPEVLLKAALKVQDQCDAIDINLGCPQNIAKKGFYGAFLQDEWDLIESMVKKLAEGLKIPVTCKIRIFDDVEKTLRYAQMLEKAGCSLLAVHGRTREQKGHNTGLADWDQIKRIVETVNIPVFANGNVLNLKDADKCLEYTKCVGVLSAEGNLYNPAIFSGKNPRIHEMVDEYLEICKEHQPPISFIRGHLFKMFKPCLNMFPEQRNALGRVKSFDEMLTVAEDFKKQLIELENSKPDYESDFPPWVCQPYIRPLPVAQGPKCGKCDYNVGSLNCSMELCKKCCIDSACESHATVKKIKV